MKKRYATLLLKSFGTCLGILFLGGRATLAETVPAKKTNIVFILIDDLGWRDLGYMGSQYYETPNIDRLASQGMVFTSAYACPNCAPSRACLISGVYTPRHGIYTVASSVRGPAASRKLEPIPNTEVLSTRWISIAKTLHTAGYVSASIGKWHGGDDPVAGPLAHGFDVKVGGDAGTDNYFSPYKLPLLADGAPSEYLTDRLTDEAIKFVEQNQSKPFFLYLPHYAVHTPIQGKKELTAKYEKKTPSNGQGNATYAAMIESVDEGIGRLLKRLDELKLTDNTIVIFTSDNGGLVPITSNQPLRGGKGQLYEGGIRVPMIVRWPGVVQPGTKSDEPIINVDFYPTLAEVAGAALPTTQPVDGLSFIPLFKGEKNLKRSGIFWHFPCYIQGKYDASGLRMRPASAVRAGDWKLLEFYEDGHRELYNVKEDIGEMNDLSKSAPEKEKEMHLLLDNWRKLVNAPIPTKLNPAYDPAKAVSKPADPKTIKPTPIAGKGVESVGGD